MLLESLWYHVYYKFNGPVVLPFCFQKLRFFEGVMKNMIKLLTSWTITEKDLPFLSTPAFDSRKTHSSVGRESKQDATFEWGFMPPYCHRDDQTWWYVGWLVVFRLGFNYWHCLYWPLTAVSLCRNFGRLVGFGSNRKATKTQFQWPEWLLQCFIMRRQTDQSHQMMQRRMIDWQIKGLKLIVIIRLFQNPKLYLCCNPESNLYDLCPITWSEIPHPRDVSWRSCIVLVFPVPGWHLPYLRRLWVSVFFLACKNGGGEGYLTLLHKCCFW